MSWICLSDYFGEYAPKMKITKIDIAANTIGGLGEIKGDKFGKIVLLAGQNGAGKTRLMNYLSQWPVTRHEIKDFGGLSPNDLMDVAKRHLEEKDLVLTDRSWNGWCLDIFAWGRVTQTLSGGQRKFSEYRERFLELRFDSDKAPDIITFVPKQVGLHDPRNDTRGTMSFRAQTMLTTKGIRDVEQNALARVQYLQDRYMDATHPQISMSDEERKNAVKEYSALQKTIEKFLSEPLSRINGDASLFGFPVGDAKLSDGQSILLQFCVAVHAQSEHLSELIVMMDEPENHLHPAAMLEAINEIAAHLTSGQLWIATHSLPLLANFDPDCIWWMNNGELSHAGSAPKKVLEGLLGQQERIDKMSNFLSLPSAIAINNFSAQCLLPPGVVMTGDADPQLQQIKGALARLHQDLGPLRILDIGAGRGRLISALTAGVQSAHNTFDYRAFDPFDDHRKECEDAIARCYPGDLTKRWFKTPK